MRSDPVTPNVSEVHIDLVKVGDTVIQNGEMKTVGRNFLKRGGFMGTTLWGDSYRSGRDLVKVVSFPQFYKGVQV